MAEQKQSLAVVVTTAERRNSQNESKFIKKTTCREPRKKRARKYVSVNRTAYKEFQRAQAILTHILNVSAFDFEEKK